MKPEAQSHTTDSLILRGGPHSPPTKSAKVQAIFSFENTFSKIQELFVLFPSSRGPFSFVFAELTGGTKRDLCPGSKLPLIQPPSMVVDGGFRNAFSLHCLLTVTSAHCISRIPLQLFRCHLVSPHSNMPSWKEN